MREPGVAQAVNLLEKETIRIEKQLCGRNIKGDLDIPEGDSRDNLIEHKNSYKFAVAILKVNNGNKKE